MSNEDLATVISVPEYDFYGSYFTRKTEVKPREIAACGGGASSVTRKQLRDCAIDSQVLIVISLLQSGRALLAKRYSFDIIRAIEFAAPKDFISLKP
ncbi:hypothetical protein LOY52_10415 [Pseudomonas sp. B21-051]|uniref:hypothetical protein n=1 Tax=Pseudomonas sp. B21-051 TaxID=2895491 RepID=UPI00215EB5FC|nr:hypothetical protein [Pseudomonas sp. B21-051]UVK90454.1 hypothetical protein LOY52_10415 [Pseudomonas sp. B21-051]